MYQTLRHAEREYRDQSVAKDIIQSEKLADVLTARRPECWCCGLSGQQHQMVHLANHPEVTICTRCARSIGKWGSEIEDRALTGLPVRARSQLRRVRRLVISQGWHHSPLIGAPLRLLGRYMP